MCHYWSGEERPLALEECSPMHPMRPPSIVVNRLPGPCPGAGLRRLGCGRSGWEGGNHGQIRVGSRREHLAHSYVKVLFGQSSLYERGLEHLDHMLAVGIGGPKAAPGRRACRLLISRVCHHRYLPLNSM